MDGTELSVSVASPAVEASVAFQRAGVVSAHAHRRPITAPDVIEHRITSRARRRFIAGDRGGGQQDCQRARGGHSERKRNERHQTALARRPDFRNCRGHRRDGDIALDGVVLTEGTRSILPGGPPEFTPRTAGRA